MSKLCELQPTESTTKVAQEAYNQTLAKHHPWFIRSGALLAMNLLPCQNTLYHQVSILYYKRDFIIIGIPNKNSIGTF